jgi:hypothetical protein
VLCIQCVFPVPGGMWTEVDVDSFHQQIGLQFKEEASKVLHLEFVRC